MFLPVWDTTILQETTGPPTVVPDRYGYPLRLRSVPIPEVSTVAKSKRYVNTECEPIFGGNPRICVYVCTDFLSEYIGEKLIREESKVYEDECPAQVAEEGLQ